MAGAVTAQGALVAWLEYLNGERRASPRTVEAYQDCVSPYLAFLEQHRAESLTLAAMGTITAGELDRAQPVPEAAPELVQEGVVAERAPAGWHDLIEGQVDLIMGPSRLALMGFHAPALGLFGQDADTVRSMALVRMAMWDPARQGILAFGSPEPKGFTSDMGAELVAFLARVVERTAERWPVL